ncbi:8679_t:CDS:2, partial [Cetraspora pellucida]
RQTSFHVPSFKDSKRGGYCQPAIAKKARLPKPSGFSLVAPRGKGLIIVFPITISAKFAGYSFSILIQTKSSTEQLIVKAKSANSSHS